MCAARYLADPNTILTNLGTFWGTGGMFIFILAGMQIYGPFTLGPPPTTHPHFPYGELVEPN
jgi:hypothetical protein